MQILITGAGGREHAIGWKLKQNPKVDKIFFSPGNGGTAEIGKNIGAKSIEQLLDFAQQNKIDLTIVGSEDLLVEGIVDVFEASGLRVLGPHKKAAQLEGSKAFAKQFMLKHGVQTATYEQFSEAEEAQKYLDKVSFPIVLKADGLAAGKGVVIAQNKEEASETIHSMMVEKTFGDAGNSVVIEEFLEGFEVSVISIYNGTKIIPFLPVKDHKQIYDGNQGPNTGGMGVIAPHPWFTEELKKDFEENILKPTCQGLEKDGLNFKGVIFFGLMCTQKGVYCLEYNIRFGDPEAQTLLSLMDSDLLDAITTAMDGKTPDIRWKNQAACLVVMASQGYPKSYPKGYEIFLDKDGEKDNEVVFVAGAKQEDGRLVTSGGRVLNIVGLGDTLAQAREVAYEKVKKINFEGVCYRTDIGVVK